MAVTIEAGELGSAIVAALSEYSDEVADCLKKECTQVAKETTIELRETSPKESGKYAGGWKSKTAFENRENIRIEVYNSKKPQITHLLEHGHVIKNGTKRIYGEVKPIPHISTAEEHAADKLGERVKVRITNGNK